MSCTEVERCMATLFTQADARRAFLGEPGAVLQHFELSDEEREGLAHMDMTGLVLAGNSFSAKRAKYKRWMHALVKSVPQYDHFVEPQVLAAARALTLRRAARLGQSSQAAPDLQRRLDFIAWDSESHHNRDHMLNETEGLAPLGALWRSLQAAVLLNHHLLRCYAVSSGSPAKQSLHREHPRAGCSLSYLVLDDSTHSGIRDDLVLVNEQQDEVVRVALRVGGCVVMPADVLHRLERGNGPADPGRVLLVFKSLSAIQ